MSPTTILTTFLLALASTVAAFSSYNVTNYCNDTKYLSLSSNEAGIIQLNHELLRGDTTPYQIDGDHSLVIANTVDYWGPETAKLVLGTNLAGALVFYSIGISYANPLGASGFHFTSATCPNITEADGTTKACADNNEVFSFTLCE